MSPNQLIRQARRDAGLTQQQLARRLGVTQATLAKLERNGSNPTIRTLQRVLRATGRDLELRFARTAPSVDESLLREALRTSPAERIAAAERLTAEAQSLATAGARARHAS
jgi:transcriptional regulator with XRE-family HTH domain